MGGGDAGAGAELVGGFFRWGDAFRRLVCYEDAGSLGGGVG